MNTNPPRSSFRFAGAEPAVAEGFGRFLRVVEIGGDGRWRAADDFADLARSARLRRRARFSPRRSTAAPDRFRMLLPVGGRADGERPRLLHPVVFVDLRAKPGGDALAQGRGEHGAGEDEPAQGSRLRLGRLGSASIIAPMVGTRFMSVTRSDSISLSVSAGWNSISTFERRRTGRRRARRSRRAEGGEHRHQDVPRRVSKASNIGPIAQC